LTQKQRRFVEEYLVDLNATQAAIRAGYSPNAAAEQGYENLIKPHVAAEIAKLRKEQSERTKVSADQVIEHLERIALYNPMDYIRIGENGDPWLDLSNLTREQALAIKDFTVEDYKEGRGEESRDVRKVRVTFQDKVSALEKLGKHLGLFMGKGEAQGTAGPPGRHTPITPASDFENTREATLPRCSSGTSPDPAGAHGSAAGH
jgi:phage terminase small subunit